MAIISTKESPSKSSAFRVKAMEEMLRKADAEPKRLTKSTGSDKKVNLEIIAGASSISSTTGAKEFPVLVRVTAPLRFSKSSRAGLDLVAVFHVGSSMLQENRLEFVKQAMMFVIDNLGRNDRLSVVSFNDKTQRLTELSFMTDENRERARREVCMLVPAGGTNMGLALNEATEILSHRALEELIMNRVGRVILISDGAVESDIQFQMPREYITVDTFGLGADHDPKLLGCIAIETGGVYSYATQDLEKMKDAIAQSLARLMSVTATDIEINLQTPEGVTISSIKSARYGQVISKKQNSGIIKVPDLYAGEQKNFIVYLDVPNGPQNHLMMVSGSYTKPSGLRWSSKIQLDKSELVVVRPKVVTTPSDETVCPDVAEEIIRVRLMELVTSVLNSKKLPLEELQRSWEDIKGSRDGFKSPQSVVLALDKDVDAMRRMNGDMFIHSWFTSHVFQRPTTKESPSKSSFFRVKAMEEMMIKKADAEQKPALESTSGDDEVPRSGMADAESKLVHFDGPLAFTGHDLCCAPAEEIHANIYESTFKVKLEDGSPVVVKQLWGTTKDIKKFEAEATVLGKTRHPNILALRAYYLKLEPKDEKLLIYDYMPMAMGMLPAFLHAGDPNKPFLDWATRMTIAKGMARGLAYLHDDMGIVHGYLDPWSIILDEQCHPKIANAGLLRLMTAEASSNLLVAVGAHGYRAPELSMLEEANEKTDVYSLGVIILELMTVNTNGRMNLPEWVVSTAELMQYVRSVVMQGCLSEIRHLPDRWIQRNMDTIMLALQCVDPSPSVRPEAREVLRQLGSDGGIRPQSEEGQVPIPAGEEDYSAESGGDVGAKLVHFDEPLALTANAVLPETSVIIGKGTYGTVYKVTLEDGSLAAVKLLRQMITKDDRMFEAEAAVLGKIRHPNLLALRAYNLEPKPEGEKVLIFDCMPKGSLFAFLHARDPNKRGDWQTRLMIAMGMARGLAYLHDDMSIIHGNLTAWNVHLDEQCNPKIADSGLFRLMTVAANCSMLSAAYVRGYRAPELGKVEEANAKTDVYSLGVIILELLTGKIAAVYYNGMDLKEWVASMVKKRRNKLFYRGLWRESAASTLRDELRDTLKLALQCVDPSPSARPEAHEVLQQLQQVRKLVHFDVPLAYDVLHVLPMMIDRIWDRAVYHVSLKDGSKMTIQWLRRENTKGQNEFEAEAVVLGKIRHPNLLALRAYYIGPDGLKLLVWDQKMLRRKLSVLLRAGDPKLLDWATRMTIAKGMARGLAYLHNDMGMVHGYLDTSSIILDEQCNPKIANTGLLRLMTAEGRSNMLGAQELSKLEEESAMTDVYSLGVIILELLTGKFARNITNGIPLPQWVASNVKEERTNVVFDPELRSDATEEELTDTLKLALQCVDPSPSMRPDAREVLRQLEQIRPNEDGGVRQGEEGHVPLRAGEEDYSLAESGDDVGGKLVHLDELLACTADDLLYTARNIISQIWHLSMHNVSLKDGSEMAIQWLMRENIKGHNEFEAEAVVLGSIRHPNLMSLRAYYMGPDGSKMLILEQMPKRSIFVLLNDHGPDNTNVGWFTRMTIIKGMARGLAYLHDDMGIIHGLLTAWSVFLDEQCNPKIANCGLLRLTTAEGRSHMLAIMGALGYRAPELGKMEEANAKTDVYSLGVIILELLTGNSTQNITNGIHLPQWVASHVKEERTSVVFDLELRSDATEEELMDTLKLALQCVDPSPSVRPKAREVLRQLEQMRKLVHFNEPLECTTDDLVSASREKIVCQNSSGTVCNVLLKDGSRMTVRCLMKESIKGQIDFEAEVAALGKIRHPNLLAFRAYYKGLKGSKMLVLDHMPVGSLYDFLHAIDPVPAQGMRLGWLIRITMMKGIARGLAYLHDDMSIICGSLTAVNVFLDEQYNPKIADFGLFRLMTAEANSNELADATAMVYRAPELSKLEEANAKTDVYSLGVIILVLLTGKDPTYSIDGMDLPQWVASIVKKERTSEVFDLELMQQGTVNQELMDTLKLALRCVDPSPCVRPEAREVLRQLEPVQMLVHLGEPLACTADDLCMLETKMMREKWFGPVRKMLLKDGSVINIKWLKGKHIKDHNEFKAEAVVLGKIRHPNLLPLRAYYMGPDRFKLLVLDHMPRGNLSEFLRDSERNKHSYWVKLIRIAKGTARGLAYLHDDMGIVHGNLTARNILLDEQCNPKIADFGLFRLMTDTIKSKSLAAVHSLGYRAPELLKVKDMNAKTDVYNLGLIVLELLTGNSARTLTNSKDFPQCVASMVKEERTGDESYRNLRCDAAEEEQLMDTLKLALQCVDPSPMVRPEAREVLRQLEHIRRGSDGGTGLRGDE